MTVSRPLIDPQFDFFVPYVAALPLRDQRETMERPFFSLAKRKRLRPIEYVSPDRSVFVNCSGAQTKCGRREIHGRFQGKLFETDAGLQRTFRGLLAAFGEGAGGSCGRQEALGKEVDPGTAIHLAFEHLQPVDLALS
jgi:hypothetical protein